MAIFENCTLSNFEKKLKVVGHMCVRDHKIAQRSVLLSEGKSVLPVTPLVRYTLQEGVFQFPYKKVL